MDAARLERIRTRFTYFRPRIFVETGTYHGATALLASEGNFTEVHTIEAALDLYCEHAPRLRDAGIFPWHGDSAVLVPVFAALLKEPVLWYLDAHWCECMPGALEGPLPLLRELNALATRRQHDIIVIDDYHCFGRTVLQPEWGEVTHERVVAMFPNAMDAIAENDQLVIYQ